MDEAQIYIIEIKLTPHRNVEYTSDAFIEIGKRIYDEVRDAAKGHVATVAAKPRMKKYPWIDTITVNTPNKEFAFDLATRVRASKAATASVAKHCWCSVMGSCSRTSLATARWIRAEGDYYDAEQGRKDEPVGNTYPIVCHRCGWPDYSKIPDPFLIHPDVLKGGKRDLFVAPSGLLIVKPRALEVLSEFAPDEFDVGTAQIAGENQGSTPFYWVRPREYIGGYIFQGPIGECCAECGRLSEYRWIIEEKTEDHIGGWILERFGNFNGNLAFIGQDPQSANLATAKTKPPTHWIAISGGLFAALYNRGVRGLALPDEGPLNARLMEGPLISIDINEPTWETERRFADAFPGKADKFMKKKI